MVRDYPLMVRLNAEEHKTLFDAARREDIPAAQLARRAIKRELARLAAEAKKARR